MSLVKHNNNSISELTTAGQLAQGKMTLISSQTASGSASIEFTSGIDSSYPIYRFEFINMNPVKDDCSFTFQGSTDGGSSYGVIATTTAFVSAHNEDDTSASLSYSPNQDQAQSTGFINIAHALGNGADESGSGYLMLFAPSSTTYVKHFMSRICSMHSGSRAYDNYRGGYFNTSSPITNLKFQMSSGTFDDIIKMYGVS